MQSFQELDAIINFNLAHNLPKEVILYFQTTSERDSATEWITRYMSSGISAPIADNSGIVRLTHGGFTFYYIDLSKQNK